MAVGAGIALILLSVLFGIIGFFTIIGWIILWPLAFIMFIVGIVLIAKGDSHPAPVVVYNQPPPYYQQAPPYAAQQYGTPTQSYPAYQQPPPAPPGPPADRYCPSCGSPNSRASVFCERCGKPLPPPR